jgi:hypothetical protein
MIRGKGVRGNRKVSPLLLLRAHCGGRHDVGAEAIPKEGSEPKASDDHPGSWLKATSVEPSVMVSPSLSLARFTRFPLTSIPFVEPRSTIQ